MKNQLTEVYLTDEKWAYNGIFQRLGDLPGKPNTNEKLWIMLGALLLELLANNIRHVIIYNDTRLVEEWNGQVKIMESISLLTSKKLHTELAPKFIKLELRKLDRYSIESAINNLQL